MSRASREQALDLDRRDPLAGFRSAFVFDDPDLIYLDGNSLGRLPKGSAARVRQVAEAEWGARLVRGWNEGWYDLALAVGEKIGRLVGAEAGEVVVSDSTSVNLFKLAAAALAAHPNRRRVVSDDLNFPSDLYVLQGVSRLFGKELVVLRSEDGLTVSDEAFAKAIRDDCALVSLSHVSFRSGFLHDLGRITRLAHEVGALVLWDLSHSAGAVPIRLGEAGADLAVGCTYKYLHGGPGAPAFLYVRRDLQDGLGSPIQGWFGQESPFSFDLSFRPAAGIRRFLVGTPPVLSLSAIEAGVDLVLEAGIERVREKSVAQTEYLIGLWEERLAPKGVRLNSPREPLRRGSHVSLGHPEALGIDRVLIERMKVIPDFRAPDNIRLGVSPLCTSFLDLFEALERFEKVLDEELWRPYARQTAAVT